MCGVETVRGMFSLGCTSVAGRAVHLESRLSAMCVFAIKQTIV